MVKGVTRQVILVKSPDPELFEQAIFIVREEAFQKKGVSADVIIRQARQAAKGYLRGGQAKGVAAIPAPAWAVIGGVFASVAWAALLYFF